MPALVSIRNVRKHFATVVAVNDVTLDVKRGEINALLGPNGAGKTTLIRMLLGLMLPDSGSIDFDGIRVTEHGPHPRDVGYLPEDRGLYADADLLRSLTYFGALRGMDRRAAAAAAEEWLERMSLRDRAREPLKTLSKGNQQKIQFITAVLHKPVFAVLDEPFSGLDPVNQDLFLTLIRELRNAGTTVLLSAHQMQLVERIADTVAVLSGGRVVLNGTLGEVRRNWTTGNRLVVRVTALPPKDFLAHHGSYVTVELREPDTIELFVKDGEPLGPLLAEIGTRLDVRQVESHHVTLHDVYVRAVEQRAGDNGGKL